MKDFFDSNNPYAYQSITATMLEATRKLDSEGNPYWNADRDVIESLVKEYAESVAEHGAACCHHTCGNPLLDKHVVGIISAFDSDVVSSDVAAKYHETMNAVAGRESVSSQPTDTDTDSSGGRDGTYPPGWFDETDETEDTVQQSGSYTSTTNETVRDGGVGTDVSQPVESVKEPEPSEDYVEGAEMEVEKSEKFNTGFSFSGAPLLGMILVIVLMVIIYWGYRRRR